MRRADSQMQALLRRHIPMPPIVLEEGVLEIVFRGDADAYREAEEDGTLQAIAEQSFYNNMESYRRYNADIEFDVEAFVVSLDEVVVTPLRKGQQLFSDYDYLTRLFSTLSRGRDDPGPGVRIQSGSGWGGQCAPGNGAI